MHAVFGPIPEFMSEEECQELVMWSLECGPQPYEHAQHVEDVKTLLRWAGWVRKQERLLRDILYHRLEVAMVGDKVLTRPVVNPIRSVP